MHKTGVREMRYAVISDIHSNFEALTKVMEDIRRRRVDEIICLGDVVGYGANPDEVAEVIRGEVKYVVKGNHDDALHDEETYSMINPYARAAIDYGREVLSAENSDWLKNLPLTHKLDGVLLVHSSPTDPHDWKYVLSEADARVELSAFEERMCLIGHTHVPVVFKQKIGDSKVRELINVGSIGQPRDGDNRASYGIIDTSDFTYENFRIEYDYQMAGNKIIAAGLPPFLAERLQRGR
jgi:putative phosphoesterase